eukprot:403337553
MIEYPQLNQDTQLIPEKIDDSAESQEQAEEVTTITGKSKKDEAYVLRDRFQLDKILDSSRIMTGQKNTDQMRNIWNEERKLNPASEDIHLNKVSLPTSIFEDYPEVTFENEKDFEYIVSQIVLQFLENFPQEKQVALEFPENLDPQARALVHALCNFIGMRSISHGKANRNNRKVIIYRDCLFPKITEKELLRIDKEKEKIREKFKNQSFAGIPRDNPITMREKLIREVFCEKRGIKDDSIEKFWDGPIEVRLKELQRKMRVYEENLKKQRDRYLQEQQRYSQNSNSQKSTQQDTSNQVTSNHHSQSLEDTEMRDDSNEQEWKLNPQPADRTSSQFSQRDSSFSNFSQQSSKDRTSYQQNSYGQTLLKKRIHGEDEKELVLQMTEEEKQAYLEKQQRIKNEKIQTQQRKEAFELELQQLLSKSDQGPKIFRDRPEEVKVVECLECEGHRLLIQWQAPNDNNCKIHEYRVYLGKKVVKRIDTHTYWRKLYSQNEEEKSQSLLSDQQSLSKDNSDFLLVGTTSGTKFDLVNLEPSSGYYIKVTAVNEIGKGYEGKSFFMQTLPYSEKDYNQQLYVWGENSSSELGITEEQASSLQSNDQSKLKSVIHNNLFSSGGLLQVAPGNTQSLMLYKSKSSVNPQIISTGSTVITTNENDQRQVFTVEQINALEFLESVPFVIDFKIPIVKVSCGKLLCGLVTATGDVYTWGQNPQGQLGLGDRNLAFAISPQKVKFPNSNDKIIDIACGFDSCIALNENKQVYVWGKKMGIYPNFNLEYHSVVSSKDSQIMENNQFEPRFLKANLIHYQIEKVTAGMSNFALISSSGDLLIQGSNDLGQLGVGHELGIHLYYFSEFMKKDFFTKQNLKVIDAVFGYGHLLVLCFDTLSLKNKVFGCGEAKQGQLGNQKKKRLYDFVELTDLFSEEVTQIATGSLHSLFITISGKLYGCGQNSEGQLGFDWETKKEKLQKEVVQINVPNSKNITISDIKCGSLFSMMLVNQN